MEKAGDSTMEKCGGYQAGYGDGPIWHEAYGVIWLDCAFEKIITFNPETGQENIYDALGQIMAIIPTTDGQFIGIYKDGLYKLNFKQRFKSPLVLHQSWNGMNYLNEGKCGPDGHIWAGSSDSFYKSFKESPHTTNSTYPFANSKLYSIDTTANVFVQADGMALSKGMDWDRSTKKFFHIDSAKHTIYQYQLEEKQRLYFEKVVYTFEMDEGHPSGMVIDREGNIWIALYKSSMVAGYSKKPTRIVCINPKKRQVIKEIELPVTHVTSCTIGGEEMDTLFITTASETLAAEKMKLEPFSGYLIQVKIDAKGVENYEFELNNKRVNS